MTDEGQLCERCNRVYLTEDCRKEGSVFFWCPTCGAPTIPPDLHEKMQLKEDNATLRASLAEAVAMLKEASTLRGYVPKPHEWEGFFERLDALLRRLSLLNEDGFDL